jgi:HK97 gp10 family phage protein
MATRRALTRGHKAFQVEGLDELQRNCDKIISRTSAEKLKEVFLHGAKIIRDEAKDLAPVRTGTLRRAIFAAPGDPRKSDALAGVSMKSVAKGGAPHAMLVEYGTSKMAPRPYMRPAIAAARPAVARIIADGIREAIEDALP